MSLSAAVLVNMEILKNKASSRLSLLVCEISYYVSKYTKKPVVVLGTFMSCDCCFEVMAVSRRQLWQICIDCDSTM